VPVLLCDLDDTLFDHDRATRDALSALRLRHPVLTRWSLDELDIRHRVWLETLHVEVLSGKRTVEEAREERFARLLDECGPLEVVDARLLAHDYRASYEQHWHPVDGALDLLKAVRADGHAIVIITNNGVAEQELKLEHCGLAAWVDAMVTSEEAGVAKPSPEIFEQALARAGATPQDAVMLGDAWTADIEGARGAGVRPVWLNRTGRPSPDATVLELSSLAPVADALDVLRRAGLAWHGLRYGGPGFRYGGPGL
jgi:putative hydrolase of the HAD superfamily